MQVHVLNSLENCGSLPDRWNALWERSTTTHPTARYEIVAEWLKQFAPQAKFRAIAVEQGNELVGLLPLVERPWLKCISVGGVPRNDWLCAGTLLLDRQADMPAVSRLIAQTMQKETWPAYRLPLIPSNDPAWEHLGDAIQLAGTSLICRYLYDVNWIDVEGDWDSYLQSRSKSHRKQMARVGRRMAERGGYRFERFVPKSRQEAQPLLKEAFAIEDTSWKGRGGSSIQCVPEMATFLERVAGHLAARGELEIAFLEFEGKRIAFEYLWNAKGVLISYKVGFDEQYENLMPGQVLMQLVLEELFETKRCRQYDCLGPVSVATAKWSNRSYPIHSWTVGGHRRISSLLLTGYKHWLKRRGVKLSTHKSTESGINENSSAESDAVTACC